VDVPKDSNGVVSGRLDTYGPGVSDAPAELTHFLEPYGYSHSPSIDGDVFGGLGIDGDDAFAFMRGFTARFGVDAGDYRWYFHHQEEGWNFGGAVFPPPYRRVERMAITTSALVEAIETKRWPLEYPAHEVPAVRWDIRLNQLLVVLAVAPLAFWVWRWLVR
jgi:hypothetical protein